MKRYRSVPDAAFAIVLLWATVLATVLLLGTADLAIRWERHVFYGRQNAPFARFLVPFAVLLAAASLARWQLLHRGVRWWCYCLVVAAAVYSWTGFESLPLHDMFFRYLGSHGRFGCRDEHYESYIFKDTTAPWILFGPLIVSAFGHWIYANPEAKSWWRWLTTYERHKPSA